jgi:FAD/FMN-containing dehydrogenase
MHPEILRPGSPGYDDARAAFNLMADLRPWGVASATTPDEVAACLRLARDEGLRVAPFATGHMAIALPDLSDTLLLRTHIAEPVRIDPVARTARVAAGTRWDPVVAAAAEHGLIGVHGSSATVGVVGYLLGGGLSLYGRRYGLASNHVRAIELVDAEGEQRRVDASNDPDLFWALRGSGGSFGVVTAIEFDLFERTTVYAGTLFWPVAQARAALTAWTAWCATTPPELSSAFRVLNLPSVPQVPEPLRGTPLAAIDVVLLGDAAQGDALVAPLRAVGPALMDTLGEVPSAAVARVLMDPEDPVPALSTTGMIDQLDAAAIDAFTEATGEGNVLLSVALRQLGGALAVAPEGAGAAAELGDGFLLFGVGVPTGPDGADAIAAGCERVRTAMAPWLGERDYLTFVEQGGDAARGFAPDVYARLVEIRERVDPQRRFVAPHRIG